MHIDPSGYAPNWNDILKVSGAVMIVSTLVVLSIVTGGTAAVIFTGAAVGGLSGGIAGGIMGGIAAKAEGQCFFSGFAQGALSGTISGSISGALAASPVGKIGQIIGNALLNGGSYTVSNINDFSLNDLLLNMGAGALGGFIGGEGWLTRGSTLAIDITLNGASGSLAIIGATGFQTFVSPVIKATIAGSSASIIDFVSTLRK